MIKYVAVPVIAVLGACSAEVENGQAANTDRVETLSVNNLVITDANTAIASSATEDRVQAPAQPGETAAPVAKSRAARPTTAQPKQQTVRKPSTEQAAKPAAKPKPAPAADPKPPQAPATTCTAEHREMGHC